MGWSGEHHSVICQGGVFWFFAIGVKALYNVSHDGFQLQSLGYSITDEMLDTTTVWCYNFDILKT